MKNILEMDSTIKKLLVSGKGILAADESVETAGKRFEKLGISNTEGMRAAYRELLFSSPGIKEYISGVILFDETLRQSADNGVPLRSLLEAKGVVLGCKIDQGLTPIPGHPDEMMTKGMEGLVDRLADYAGMNVKFVKWRAVFKIDKGLPSKASLKKNAELLAEYAAASQQVGIVPIVEPEVLSDGKHSSERCFEVTEEVHRQVFDELKNKKVDLRFVLLKPNMIVPGSESGEAMRPEQVGNMTVSCLLSTVPKEVPGIVFLSGGQSEAEACENMNAVASHQNLPWVVTYSFGRALQNSTLKIWSGNASNIEAAQKAFLHQASLVSLAQQGKYK